MKTLNSTATYQAVFNSISEGGFEVSFPDFPGCVTFGNTFEEAQKMASEVLSLWIEELEADHKTIPDSHKRPIIADVTVSLA